jgi:hypothetical protein
MNNALPPSWLHHKLVEAFCTETKEDGTTKLTAGAIDSPVLWLKFRTELYPQVA